MWPWAARIDDGHHADAATRLLHHQRRPGQGRQPRRTRRRRRALPGAGARRPAPATARGAPTSAHAAAASHRERATASAPGPGTTPRACRSPTNVADLHSDNNKLPRRTALTEKGEVVNGRGDTPNQHDILTGSNLDGTRATGAADTTCSNWTSSGDGSARSATTTAGRRHEPDVVELGAPSRGCSQDEPGRHRRRRASSTASRRNKGLRSARSSRGAAASPGRPWLSVPPAPPGGWASAPRRGGC